MTMFRLEDIKSGEEFRYCTYPFDLIKVLRIIRLDIRTGKEVKHD